MAAVCLSLVVGCLVAAGSALDPLTYTLSEEEPSGTHVGNIKLDANLMDIFSPSEYSRLTFNIPAPVDGDVMAGSYFFVDNSTGILSVSTPLDRDSDDLCAFQPDCVLSFDIAIGPNDLFRVLPIHIHLTDINDNPPRFSSSEVSLNISEMASVGSSFPLPLVSDKDGEGNGVVKMSLSPVNNYFRVLWSQSVSSQARPRLELQSQLDREQISAFVLTVTASDGGSPPHTANLLIHIDVIDANDNSPTFEQQSYEFSLPEGGRAGSLLPAVTASDQDKGENARVSYSLAESTLEQHGVLFNVDENSGRIRVASSLDRETQAVYYLGVVAKDHGKDRRAATATITLSVTDVNDNAPSIHVTTLTVSGEPEILESADIGTFVALLSVKDVDTGMNARIDCRLNTADFHLVALQANKYKLVTSVMLDREARPSYTVEVFCEDGGAQRRSATRTLAVRVTDTNDHSPVFSHGDLTVHVKENTASGALLGQVYATDPDDGPNAHITYSSAAAFSRYIHVNEYTGAITSIASLDHEATKDFSIHVVASDGGDPPRSAMCTVTVVVDDVNDNPPRFTQSGYTFLVPENEHQPRELGTVTAIDPDGVPFNKVEYSLMGPNSYFFSIDSDNGTITSIRPLDRETHTVLVVQVQATDADNPALRATANVSVYVSDVNDNRPVIVYPSLLNSTVTIPNSLEPGDFVAQVVARDDDAGQNAALEYDIRLRSPADLLTIDSVTGMIQVTAGIRQIQTGVVSCVIIVRDLGIPSLAAERNLTVIINESTEVRAAELEAAVDAGMNMTIIIVVIATTIVVVAVLVAAIVFVFMKLRRNKKPKVCVEKVAVSYDAKKAEAYSSGDTKPVSKIYGAGAVAEADRDSCGSVDGSTTDSGRGASEEGDNGCRHNDSSDTKMTPCVFPSADDSIVSSTYDFNSSYDHMATVPRRSGGSHKSVTFQDDVTIHASDAALPTSPPRPTLSTSLQPPPTLTSALQPPPTMPPFLWSPDTAPPGARRTVRDVKAKDRNKRQDTVQHTPSCPEYRRPYDFNDSASLLRYKPGPGEGSNAGSEVTDATSVTSATSGSYVIDHDDDR